jgi:squalene-hopene/tetraprenyl-beta-curcumene cyclase
LPGGPSDFDATVRCYFALKLHAPESDEPLARARQRLAAWGAGRCGSRTRLLLALFGQLRHDDWSSVPAASSAEALALQVTDAHRPARLMPRDALLAHLFRDDRPRAGSVWSPLRAWNGWKAAEQLQQMLAAGDSSEAGGPTTVLPLIALKCLGRRASDEAVQAAWRRLDERIIGDNVAVALTPLRDTALALAALREAGLPADAAPITAAGEWLWARLVAGQARGNLAVEDAALVLIALAKSGFAFHGDRPGLVDHVLHSILDEQDNDGGWGTPERTGLVLEALGHYGIGADEPVVADAFGYLARAIETAGCWRVLAGLRAVDHGLDSPLVRNAAIRVMQAQHAGGGWDDGGAPAVAATAQALLALMAAGDANCPEVDAGVDWLLNSTPESFEEIALALMALGQFERHAAGWNS